MSWPQRLLLVSGPRHGEFENIAMFGNMEREGIYVPMNIGFGDDDRQRIAVFIRRGTTAFEIYYKSLFGKSERKAPMHEPWLSDEAAPAKAEGQ